MQAHSTLWTMTTPYSYAANDDAYDVLGFAGGSILRGTQIVGTTHANMLDDHTLFIHSERGLQGDSLTYTGETSVVRRVVLDQPRGGMVHDFHSMQFSLQRTRSECSLDLI